MTNRRTRLAMTVGALASVVLLAGPSAMAPTAAEDSGPGATTTPIQHVVVIVQENVSFDHYFGTYPVAVNPPGEPAFVAEAGTPTINGLTSALLTANPNASNPQRLDRSQLLVCDQNHDYGAEQRAFDRGVMDLFVETLGAGGTQNDGTLACNPQQVMDYYDGNTVTALWNYAQRFAMSDNFYGTGFGPSTPGALNLASGNTFGVICGNAGAFGPPEANPPPPPCPPDLSATPGTSQPQGTSTILGDSQPLFDMCSNRDTVAMGGRNVGDLLNDQGVTWGWFEGGFRDCAQAHRATGVPSTVAAKPDYIPHHEPFQYYASTANPNHLPPSSTAAIGHTDQANHQYDLTDFWAAVDAGNLPAISFLKAPAYQDGHAGYSTPLDEQNFLVQTLNGLQKLDSWRNTAVIITYDDSDGWYDHQMSPILFQSQTGFDALTAPYLCGANPARVPSGQQTRCGYGPRLPLLVLSPFARHNVVDHSLLDQASILRFIEDNWNLGRIGQGSADALAGNLTTLFDFNHRSPERLLLDPSSGDQQR